MRPRFSCAERSASPFRRWSIQIALSAMIEWLKLFNTGLGYVDVHLLAATQQLTQGLLWTRDKRLHAQAERLGVAFAP